jgi:glycosyltransferase involved in cell wall biosynthesis
MPDSKSPGRSLKVLFDGSWWIDGPLANREVQREFILAWLREFPDDSAIISVPNSDVATVQREVGHSARVIGTRIRPHGVGVILELALRAARLRPDVTVTHNFTPLHGRSAVFVHDFLFRTDPQWFTRAERAYFSLMPATIRLADVVLTSTASEAERITRTSAATTATAVGLGLNRSFENATPRRPAALADVDGFLLTVGRLNARKNLATTIRAARESGAATPTFPLLVVGEKSGLGASLPDSVQAALADGSVRLMGRIDVEELRWLYENAALFLFLTLDEGFGMPTLEALATGAPLLVSDIPVFREILGDRATFVDPRDVAAVTASIASLVAAPRPPADATAVLEHYTWENAVHRMRAAIVEGAR